MAKETVWDWAYDKAKCVLCTVETDAEKQLNTVRIVKHSTPDW